MEKQKPTKDDLKNAIYKTVPDLVRPNLKLLFVGINPGLYTAAIGHHFGHPGNRFWPALYSSGLIDQPLTAYDSDKLLNYNFGITNMVSRTTNLASELSKEELQKGAIITKEKIKKFKPEWVAFLGLTSYRIAFNQPKALLGLQPEKISNSRIWLLPNPSGLNAHFTPKKLTEVFKELKEAIS